MAVRRYKGCTIETSSYGKHSQVRQDGEFIKGFKGPTSYEDAKRWVDEQIATEAKNLAELREVSR